MQIRFPSLFILLFMLSISVLFSQTVDEDSLFGGAGESSTEERDSTLTEDGLFGSSEDDLFDDSDASMVEEIIDEEDDSSNILTEFLSNDEVQIGGRLDSSFTTVWYWDELPRSGSEFLDTVKDLLLLPFSTTVYLNARPSNNLRVFMKAKAAYPFETSISNGDITFDNLNVIIFELYSDVNFNQKLFFRFGKQTVNWGVGYFWSPADFISLVPINTDDPDAEREGPIAVKISVPLGLQELNAYVIADENVRNLEDLGLAARGSFYFDFGDLGLEAQLGLGYQKDRPFRVMSSLQLPLKDLNVFLEARLSFGRQGEKLISEVLTEEDTKTYFSGTAGFLFRKSNIFESILDLIIIGQYYFQGEGYDDSSLLTAAISNVFAGNIHISTLENFGMHYTALSLGINQLFLEDLSISSFWIANWSDISGQVNTSINYRFFDGLSFSFGIINSYGDNEDEYGSINGRVTRKNPFGKLALSLTLNLGGGAF